MCGVSKVLKIWKEQEDDTSPRCSIYEEATHIWTCQSPSNRAIWDQRLMGLKEWLIKKETDPDLTLAIISGLRHWISPCDPLAELSEGAAWIYHLQEEIGWNNFLEGFHHKAWQDMQKKYYHDIRSLKSGKTWNIALIQELWALGKALLTDRNEVMHAHTNIATECCARRCLLSTGDS
jgi:hypothetical protein